LSITKQLCELMKGGIRISSEVDRGSLFEFFVMLTKSNTVFKEYPRYDIGKPNILIVDDNLTNREVLKGQLTQWGAIVDAAPGGLRALEILNSNMSDLFDIVLIDMEMSDMGGVELARRIRSNPSFDPLKLVMMRSISHREDEDSYSELGFQDSFSKPISARDLHETITSHRPGEVKNMDSDNGRLLATSGLFQGTRVLLVEDNKINQVVATGMLEILGFTIFIADNGREALNILNAMSKEDCFQIILMDCQMPVMDGYETTEAIRNGQAGKINQTITIVAMTANAMKGDKDKCMEAGMSDYISKPIDVGSLTKILLLHLACATNSLEGNELPPRSKNKLVWNRKTYFEAIGNDERAVKIISMCVDSIPGDIKSLGGAVISKDRGEIARIAHRIKGSTSNLYGEQITEYLSELE